VSVWCCLSKKTYIIPHSNLLHTFFARHTAARTKPNLHYMICWPEKLAVKAMEFFKFRFSMHSQVYTHKTVKAVEFMVCDILTLADPHIKIPTKDPNVFKRISTAMENPDSYVLLKVSERSGGGG